MKLWLQTIAIAVIVAIAALATGWFIVGPVSVGEPPFTPPGQPRPAPEARPVVADTARAEIPPQLPVVIRSDTVYEVKRMWFVPHGKTMMIECQLEVKKEGK